MSRERKVLRGVRSAMDGLTAKQAQDFHSGDLCMGDSAHWIHWDPTE